MTVAIGPEGGGRVDEPQSASYAVLEQMPVGVVIAKVPGGRVVFRNQQAERIWRRPFPLPDGVAGYHRWRGFHPDGTPYLAAEWPLARAVLHGETVQDEEIQILRGDGTRAVIRVSANPVLDGNGVATSAVATFHDTTAQRGHEVARRFLAEAGSMLSLTREYETTLAAVARLAVPLLADWCGVDLVSEDGRVVRIAGEHADPAERERVARIAERFPTSLAGVHGAARVLREGRSRLVPDITDAILRRVAQNEEHLAMLRGLGLRSAMIVPLNVRGRTIGSMTFFTARSDRHYGADDLDLAEELAARAAMAIDNARLYQESQTANHAKSDFLAVMSHELRTPLTAIIGYAELLELGIPEPISEHQLEQVQRISVSSQHLLALIEEILAVVNLEAGHARVVPERLPLGELLDRVVAVAEPLAREKGLALLVADAPREECLEVDAAKVAKILLNLLSNAVKFTPEGQVELIAALPPGTLVLTVRDTGIGMTEAHRRRAFDPFWQAEDAITREAGGTGLGLTVIHRLVALLRGEVDVESEPGRGSTFTVRLPVSVPGDPPNAIVARKG